MSEAVRVGDLAAHGTPIQGRGSPDVFIGNMKAWRAIPAGVGGGLEEASKKVKAIMDKFPSLPSPSDPAKLVTQDLTEIFEKMLDTAAKAEEAAKMCGALAGVQSAFMSFQPTAMGLLATYTSAAAAPGAEPAARLAFTAAFQAGLGTAMSAAVTAIAGAWDMNNCPAAIPGSPLHATGLVTVGCKTIFINGLPAVVKGHQIIEAAGGPNAIQIGCGNVFFGDKAPSVSSGEGGEEGSQSGDGGGSGAEPTGKSEPTKAESAATGADSATEPEIDPPKEFRVCMCDSDQSPMALRPYFCELGGASYSGNTDADGFVILPEQAPGTCGWIEISPDKRNPDYKVRCEVRVGEHAPPNTPQGASMRLANLGYYTGGPVDSLTMDLRRALMAFQKDQPGLAVTGNLDGMTADRLRGTHET